MRLLSRIHPNSLLQAVGANSQEVSTTGKPGAMESLSNYRMIWLSDSSCKHMQRPEQGSLFMPDHACLRWQCRPKQP